jgi:ABC-2 type transport system permease protein
VSGLEHAPAPAELRGPSAVGGDIRRFASLAWTLAVTDFRLKFFGSVLGYLWQLMRPLLLFGVIYVVFAEFVQLGDDVRFYPVVLLTGIILFTYFGETTGAAVTSVMDRESLLRKVRFPRLVIPASVALTAMLNFGLNVVVILIFALASGVEPTWSWLQAPLLLAALVFYAFGFAMLLSALFVRYRDVKPIWDVVLQVTFYGTPLLYPIEVVKYEWARELIMMNPLAVIVQQFRHAVLDPTVPGAAGVVGGYVPLLIPLAIAVGIFALGLRTFLRQAPRIAEDL